jgi:hypothetical protein
MTIKTALKQYLKNRLTSGSPFISSHEFEDARNFIKLTTDVNHNVSTIERAWRQLRIDGEIYTVNANIPGKREHTWKIISVSTS